MANATRTTPSRRRAAALPMALCLLFGVGAVQAGESVPDHVGHSLHEAGTAARTGAERLGARVRQSAARVAVATSRGLHKAATATERGTHRAAEALERAAEKTRDAFRDI